MSMKHKHSELIKAWADGAKIQYLDVAIDKWFDTYAPSWQYFVAYRIKPVEPVLYVNVYKDSRDACLHFTKDGAIHGATNYFNELTTFPIKITFSSETNKPIAVELVKE